MEIEIDYSPHKNQILVHNDTHRFRIVVAGRRFGKTILAINELIKEALTKPGSEVWYIAPTYRQAEQIAWKLLFKYLPKQIVTKIHETKLTVKLINGSTISLKGVDNKDSLRGVGLNFVVLDEYEDMPEDVWEEIIRPELTDTQGKALFIGTPKGFNKLYTLFNRQDADYKAFKFKTADNPFIKPSEIEKARAEVDPDTFAQEYEADFRHFTGLVYKDFNRETHVVEPIEALPGWAHYMSIDFGYKNATAVLWYMVDYDGVIYVTDELYVQEWTTEAIINEINAKSAGLHIRQRFGDPSAKQLIADYQRYGVVILPAHNDVTAGIAKVTEYMKINPYTKRPRLRIFKNCVNLIRELEDYQWEKRTKEGQNEKETPRKLNDHAVDSLRYFIATFTKARREIKLPELQAANSITGW